MKLLCHDESETELCVTSKDAVQQQKPKRQAGVTGLSSDWLRGSLDRPAAPICPTVPGHGPATERRASGSFTCSQVALFKFIGFFVVNASCFMF